MASKASKAHQLVQDLDDKYKKSRRDWSKKSSTFQSSIPRLNREGKVNEGHADPARDSIGSIPRAERGSAWSKSKQPMRPGPRKLIDKFYDPKDPNLKAPALSAPFKSKQPKFEEKKLLPGQEKLGVEDKEPPKGRPSSALVSKAPRLGPTKKAHQVHYDYDHNTMGSVLKNKVTGSSWSKSKAAQRPPPKKVLDKVYDIPRPKSAGIRSTFASKSERFIEVKAQAPDPGTYTSALVSAGPLTFK